VNDLVEIQERKLSFSFVFRKRIAASDNTAKQRGGNFFSEKKNIENPHSSLGVDAR
jgi:hypothetical protein